MGVTYLSGWLASEYNLSPSVYGVLDDVSALLGGVPLDTVYSIMILLIAAVLFVPFLAIVLFRKKK